MCKDGKCKERAGQTRNTVISLGTAARELARLSEHPQMVVKTPTHIAFVTADPELYAMPGVTVVIEVYPTTSDDDIAQKADSYLTDARRNPPPIIRMLEQLFGSVTDAPDVPTIDAQRPTSAVSAQTA